MPRISAHTVIAGDPALTRRFRCSRLGLLLLILSVTLPAWGSDTRHYRVEMVVFESLDKRMLQSEVWPADPEAPSVAGAIELQGVGYPGKAERSCPPGDGNCQSAAQPGATRHDFYGLPTSEHRLGGVVNALRASGRYRPLLHVAWQQPGFARQNAPAVHITAERSRETKAGLAGRSRAVLRSLDGTIRVYRGRYLHVLADLAYYRPEPTPTSPADPHSALLDGALGGLAPPPRPSPFRLSEHRRMRFGELHYFDHPLFGLLIEILPYRDSG